MQSHWVKSLSSCVLCLLLAIALAGCAPAGGSDGAGSTTDNDAGGASGTAKLRVMATGFAPFDFARQITGDLADVKMLLPPGTESHSFEPTPKDIVAIGESDIFIYVGGESDAWVTTVLESVDTGRMTIITLIDCVQTVAEEEVEGMQPEDDEDAGAAGASTTNAGAGAAGASTTNAGAGGTDSADATPDEHVWTSPQNAKLIVERIAAACKAADPANAQTYQQNTTAYLAQLDTLDAQFRQVVAAAQRKTLVFGDRFPFRYFTDAYGLDYFAAFPGCSSQTEASAATVAFLIDKVRTEQTPVVLKIELSSGAIAQTIADATGAKVETLSSAHNVSRDDFAAGATYLSIMERNLAVLQEALL